MRWIGDTYLVCLAGVAGYREEGRHMEENALKRFKTHDASSRFVVISSLMEILSPLSLNQRQKRQRGHTCSRERFRCLYTVVDCDSEESGGG